NVTGVQTCALPIYQLAITIEGILLSGPLLDELIAHPFSFYEIDEERHLLVLLKTLLLPLFFLKTLTQTYFAIPIMVLSFYIVNESVDKYELVHDQYVILVHITNFATLAPYQSYVACSNEMTLILLAIDNIILFR